MRRLFFISGVILIAFVVAIGAWLAEEGRGQRKMILRGCLWGRDGEQLALLAHQVRRALAAEGEAADREAFVPWDKYPLGYHAQVTDLGLQPVATDRSDGLVVTTFVRAENLEARWFYVVPVSLGSEKPWFRVVAMTPEYLLYNAFPDGLDPVIEKQREQPVDPIKVIRRLCSERDRAD